MTNEEMREGLGKLRSTLTVIDEVATSPSVPPEGLADLGQALDQVRKDVWGVLVAEHSGDYAAYLGKVRVRRAIDTCRDVVADFGSGEVNRDTPGIEVLNAAAREVQTACRAVLE